MTSAWMLVGLAVIAEIAAALGLRLSNGFTKPVPSILSLAAFGLAFYLVSLSLVDLPVSVVYPVWAGGGTAGIAVIGTLVLKEGGGPWKAIGTLLVISGIVVLNFV